ncbi:tetratricopeptide repeat protein [Cellulosimicrobium terreum]|nr:tetratricopeptide repeat protein [Cellulosimicrobium terreum]
MTRRTGGPAEDAAERNLDLAWELFAAQPTHPRVAELALQALADQPERSSTSLLLAHHREACGEHDEARRLYLDVAGRRDAQFLNAARAVRHLAFAQHDHPEALRWARTVLREDQEEWDDWMELGSAQALCGEHESGWTQLDEAVALCARTTQDELPAALGKRAAYLLETFAPADRFVPAAEEAIRSDAASPWVALMLGWSYLVQYRFADAEQLALRLLREDPTEDMFRNLLGTARTMQRVVEDAGSLGYTMEDVRRTGVLEMTWQQLRDRELGIDLVSALAALDDVLPADLRATLRPGASFTDEAELEHIGAMAQEDLLTWRDGQQPGTGTAWAQAEPFRLMSAAEIVAMSTEIEADPAAHPDWPEDEAGEQVMTDDAGAYLVVVAFGALVRRRPGQPDEPVAPSMADWVWDRVAELGGRDPRPAPLRTESRPTESRPTEASTDLPVVPGTALAGTVAAMYAALGAAEHSAAYAELRAHFPGSTVRRSALGDPDPGPEGVDIAVLDGLVKQITVDVALCPSADRVITGLDLGGDRRSVADHVRERGVGVHNSWERRSAGVVTARDNYDLAQHRLGVEWRGGKLARIVLSATERADGS